MCNDRDPVDSVRGVSMRVWPIIDEAAHNPPGIFEAVYKDLNDPVDLVGIIRKKLNDVYLYAYSDGAVLFDSSICLPEESAKLDDSGMVDALARVLADDLKGNIERIVKDQITKFLSSKKID